MEGFFFFFFFQKRAGGTSSGFGIFAFFCFWGGGVHFLGDLGGVKNWVGIGLTVWGGLRGMRGEEFFDYFSLVTDLIAAEMRLGIFFCLGTGTIGEKKRWSNEGVRGDGFS